MNEDYVSFETAKLLKEKGFDEETEHELWYVVEKFSTGCHWNSCTYKVGDITREYDEKYCIAMPTLQMAMKWLRETHKIFFNVNYYNLDIGNEWLQLRINRPNKIGCEVSFEGFGLEEQYDKAIKYCLENLI
jgi:hypothetical protein